jgi:hypothetical protein
MGLALLVCMAAGAADVQLFNGDFELAPQGPNLPPPGWFSRDESPDYGVTTLTEGAHGGRQCIRMRKDRPGPGFAIRSRLYPCVAGQKYTATCWVFNEQGDAWLYLEFYSNEENRVLEKHLGAGKVGSWETITVEDVCPANAKYVGALLYSSGANVGVSRLDDVALGGPLGEGQILNLDIPEVEVEPPEDKLPDIGSRLEPFVDDYLIESMKDVSLQLHSPERQEIAVTLDAPWEGDTSHYITVFKDDDRYRMYYRGSVEAATETIKPHAELAAYAESPDGIRWTKPNLGIYELNGSKDNAITYMGRAGHNFTPFKDSNPAAKPEEKYKALGGGPLFALASPDGLHWQEMQADPVITDGAFDSQNLAFYDSQRGVYVAYVRDFKSGVRDIRTCTSPDFIHWTKPQWLRYGKAPKEHLYTNAISPYPRAPHLYFGFPKRFMEARKVVDSYTYPGLSDGVFMTSRDGLHFRRWEEAFLRPGLDQENWTDRNNHIAYGMVETGPEELSLYALEHYQHPTNRIRRITIRPDGFVSVHAGATQGELVTKPIRFAGKELVINFSTSIVGGVQVEAQTVAGAPIPGLTLGECPVIYGDRLEQVVKWDKGSDLSALAGQPTRFRFVMKDADLYSLRFK